MNNSQRFWRGLFFIVLIAALCGGLALPLAEGVPAHAAPPAQAATNIIISEFATRGLSGVYDEFVELYNPTTNSTVDISGWTIRKSSGCGSSTTILETIPAGVSLNPGQHYLAAGFSYTGTVTPDYRHPSNWAIEDNGGIALLDSSANVIDQVGMCATTTYLDGTPLLPLSGTLDQSYERQLDISNSCVDANNNSSDFFILEPSDPQNSSSPLTACGNATSTPTPSSTSTPTNTPTETATATNTSSVSTSIVISEIRFHGSGGAADEFIELHNSSGAPVAIGGWIIRKSSGCGSTISQIVTIPAGVTLSPGQHYLIGGTSYNDTVTPDLPNQDLSIADDGGIALFNGPTLVDQVGLCSTTLYGEGTRLSALTTSVDRGYDRRGGGVASCIDSNNNASDFFLRNPSDPQSSSSPLTACGNPTPTPTLTRTPTRTRTPSRTPTKYKTRTPIPAPPPPLVAINEFVPRPGHDWNHDGVINNGDEYIELLNFGVVNVNLSGYSLDDEVNIGSSPYRLPAITMKPGERIVFYGSQTGLQLSDGGDAVRLNKPNGQLADAYNYSVVRFPDESFCRLPDNGGLDDWNQFCFPTPGMPNSQSESSINPPTSGDEESLCPIADTLPQDFAFAECLPFGHKIWNSTYWDLNGWFGEKSLPGSPNKWTLFGD